MPLTPGTRLGPYEIVTPLGAGGMGEVYRAMDPRLGRDVAIKALPEGFAQDPERLARFEREAKLLASLSHANVAGIHGLEEVEGQRYLVLELVEGETLAARIARGPLTIEDALEVCRQVAAGVEAAHEAGIVHRDLKPGNVMLKSDGSVKVLDFGLAKSGAGAAATSQDPSLSASPTVTYAATSAGVILGTVAYMSPEQARGRAVDKRSDVWSFGCLLYECLTARQAFHGDTASDVIAAILRTEADLGALPAETPARVRELLARCLCKDARDRLRDIGEARVLLGAVQAGESSQGAPAPARGGGVPLWLAAVIALALAALSVAVVLVVTPRHAAAPVRKLDLVAENVGLEWFMSPQLSPDGGRIAYVAKGQLWVRDLARLEPRPLAPVEGMTTLCWSPDSREIAFNDRKKLWKVEVTTGTPVALCDLPGSGKTVGITWSSDGTLAFSAWRGGMYTTSAAGGAPRLLIDIDPREIVDFHAPVWLENGDLLYLVHWKEGRGPESSATHGLEIFAGGRRIPISGQFGDEGQPTAVVAGMILFVRGAPTPGVWAIHYDARSRRTSGEPRLVANGAVSVSVSKEGSLLYMEGTELNGPSELVWVDRTGKLAGSTGAAYPGLGGAVLAPDGRHVAFTAVQDNQSDVWVRDLARGTDTRITFSKNEESSPQWMGANRVCYLEGGIGPVMPSRLIAVNADGSGGSSVLATPTGSSWQRAQFARDGRTALRTFDEGGMGRMRVAQVQPDGSLGPPTRFLRFTPEPDVGFGDVALSPDGRLAAYFSNLDQPEVFLARFPSGEGPWQVSTEGGRRPRWAGRTGTLYYMAGNSPAHRWLVEVSIDSSQDPPVGRSTKLFDFGPSWAGTAGNRSFDVAADGQRFLITRELPGTSSRTARMVLVQNWQSEFAKPEVR